MVPFVVDQKMMDQGVLWIMFLAFLLVGIPALWMLAISWIKASQARNNSVDVERRQREEKRDMERSALTQQLIGLVERVTENGAKQTEVMRSADTHIQRGNITHDRFVDLVTRMMEKMDLDAKALHQRLEIMHGELRQVLQLQQLENSLSRIQKEKARQQAQKMGNKPSQPRTSRA